MTVRMPARLNLGPVLIGLLALCVAASASAHNAFIVNLKNGSTLISKYRPVTAAFDDSFMLVMTSAGNSIAIEKSSIESIVSDLENRGFGVVIDVSTVIVGRSANDAEQLDLSTGGGFQDLQGMLQMQNFANNAGALAGGGQSSGFASPSFDGGATNAPSGGISLNFVGTPVIPVDGGAPPQ